MFQSWSNLSDEGRIGWKSVGKLLKQVVGAIGLMARPPTSAVGVHSDPPVHSFLARSGRSMLLPYSRSR